MPGLVRFAGGWTRAIHHGQAGALSAGDRRAAQSGAAQPLVAAGRLARMPEMPRLMFHEWGAVVLGAAGIVMVVTARTRVGAIVALGVQGTAARADLSCSSGPRTSPSRSLEETLSVVISAPG